MVAGALIVLGKYGVNMRGTGWCCPTCRARDDSPCLGRKGRLRRNHMKRRLLAGVNTLVKRHAHRLPLDDRLQLAASLLAPESEKTTASTTRVDDGQVELAAPHWGRLWRRLLAASSIIHLTRSALTQPDSGLSLQELDTELQNLQQKIIKAYNLCGKAPRLDGLVVRPGIDLASLQHRVAIYDAKQVDAGLRQRSWAPEDTTSDWTVTYNEHGAFIARAHQPTADLTEPDEFRGFASTPLAADDLIKHWFTGVATVRITFDPAAPKRPQLATFTTPDSDVPGDFEGYQRVLEGAGPCYEQLHTACTHARERLRDVEIAQFLTQRAALLNDTDPLLPYDRDLRVGDHHNSEHHEGWMNGACWVPTRLIVSAGGRWGAFGDHRPEVPGKIAEALAGTVDLDQFLAKFFSSSGAAIDLVRIPAWAGPLYLLGSNGTHRIHTAAMLELPWLCATVTAYVIGTKFDLTTLCDDDIDNPLPWRSDDNYDQRMALLTGMIRRDIIHGEIVVDNPSRPRWPGRLRCRYLPAPWLLCNPQYTVRVNTTYESRYPGALAQLGIPIEVGTHSNKWIEWLTSPGASAR